LNISRLPLLQLTTRVPSIPSCDTWLSVVDVIGFRKLASVKRLQDSAYRAWFSGLACSVLAGVYTLWRLSQKQKTLDLKEGEGVVEAKKLEKYALDR
jgi:peroxin-11B